MHKTVLLDEAVEGLNIKPDGVYIDATFGRGGHSALIVAELKPEGRLIVCDQDITAIELAKERFCDDARVTVIHDNFGGLGQHLRDLELWGKVDGILFDLGVSSPQLDEAHRGFSFLKDGPLDMRMDQTRGIPLSEKLKTVELKELIRVLRDYGEEKFSPKIAEAIIKKMPQTTKELADLVSLAIPKKFHEIHKHPATRTFQALRIWLNGELTALERVLQFFPDILKCGGRAVFISFHSLEDRLVKERMRELTSLPSYPRGLPIQHTLADSPPMQICIKMHKPSDVEIQQNPRARSAVLRVMERVK